MKTEYEYSFVAEKIVSHLEETGVLTPTDSYERVDSLLFLKQQGECLTEAVKGEGGLNLFNQLKEVLTDYEKSLEKARGLFIDLTGRQFNELIRIFTDKTLRDSLSEREVVLPKPVSELSAQKGCKNRTLKKGSDGSAKEVILEFCDQDILIDFEVVKEPEAEVRWIGLESEDKKDAPISVEEIQILPVTNLTPVTTIEKLTPMKDKTRNSFSKNFQEKRLEKLRSVGLTQKALNAPELIWTRSGATKLTGGSTTIAAVDLGGSTQNLITMVTSSRNGAIQIGSLDLPDILETAGLTGANSNLSTVIPNTKLRKKLIPALEAVCDRFLKLIEKRKVASIVIGRIRGIDLKKYDPKKTTGANGLQLLYWILLNTLKTSESLNHIYVVEENHTSLVDFTADEFACVRDQSQTKGKRIVGDVHHFRTSAGLVVDADVNAAYNILRLLKPQLLTEGQNIFQVTNLMV